MAWKAVERKCCRWLCATFGHLARFELQGGADPMVSDILVTPKHGPPFYIEVKSNASQCGQFAIRRSASQHFLYSQRNRTAPNPYSQDILNALTMQNPSQECSTASFKIREVSDPSVRWIVDHYKARGVRYFITEDFDLFPVEAFGSYFDVLTVMRLKKSGSAKVGIRKAAALSSSIIERSQRSGKTDMTFKVTAGKLLVFTDANLAGTGFHEGKHDYQFLPTRTDRCYELRRLSNTRSASIVFIGYRNANHANLVCADTFNAILRGETAEWPALPKEVRPLPYTTDHRQAKQALMAA